MYQGIFGRKGRLSTKFLLSYEVIDFHNVLTGRSSMKNFMAGYTARLDRLTLHDDLTGDDRGPETRGVGADKNASRLK